MAYCTLADLIERYGERQLIALTDRGDFATNAIDEPTVERAIADTAAVIDGYVATRYALPIDPVQPLLRDLALAIAIWKLHTAAPDPKVEADYKEALRQLSQIAQGLVRLNAAGIEAPGTGGSGARLTDRARPLTADNLKGFI